MLPKKSYYRTTKSGLQLVVPAKHTIAKLVRKQNEKNKQTNAEKETSAEPESRKA